MAGALHIYNHQSAAPVCMEWWQRIAELALPRCLEASKPPSSILADLEEIEISLVTDDVISRVHQEYMNDRTPTDVITFHHGEILISTETAARQAAEHHSEYPMEIALYIVHGLLHLAGWHDGEPEQRAEMHERQSAILHSCMALAPLVEAATSLA
jgi:probable rRNA maturation factor